MSDNLKFLIGSIILSCTIAVTFILALYLGCSYIALSYELSKSTPLDVCDRVIIVLVEMVMILICFCFIYHIASKFKKFQ